MYECMLAARSLERKDAGRGVTRYKEGVLPRLIPWVV